MSESVDREVDLDAPPDEVWPAITDPARLGAWLDADVELDVRPGGEGRFTFPDGEVRHALVHEVDPGRELSFSWWRPVTGASDPSTVTFTLVPVDGGTVLRVREVRAAVLRAAA